MTDIDTLTDRIRARVLSYITELMPSAEGTVREALYGKIRQRIHDESDRMGSTDAAVDTVLASMVNELLRNESSYRSLRTNQLRIDQLEIEKDTATKFNEAYAIRKEEMQLRVASARLQLENEELVVELTRLRMAKEKVEVARMYPEG